MDCIGGPGRPSDDNVAQSPTGPGDSQRETRVGEGLRGCRGRCGIARAARNGHADQDLAVRGVGRGGSHRVASTFRFPAALRPDTSSVPGRPWCHAESAHAAGPAARITPSANLTGRRDAGYQSSSFDCVGIRGAVLSSRTRRRVPRRSTNRQRRQLDRLPPPATHLAPASLLRDTEPTCASLSDARSTKPGFLPRRSVPAERYS